MFQKVKSEAQQWAAFREYIAEHNEDGLEAGLDVLRECGAEIAPGGKRLILPKFSLPEEEKNWRESLMPYKDLIIEGLRACVK